MEPEEWARLKDWFGEAVDSPERLPEILAEAERASPALAAELRSLIKEHEAQDLNTRAVLDQPPKSLESPEAHPDGPPGGEIGPYRILRELGRGGTGLVFLAERSDDEFHRPVALKVLRYIAWDKRSIELLTQERSVLSQLQHPHIAALIDWGTTPEGAPWLATEYVEGQPIDQYCRAHDLGIDETIAVFEQVCQAVQYAHRQLVVHRDLKPANILVTPSGLAKLLDFGISKPIDADHVTSTMDRRFTPAYASPEQIQGRPITASTDIYALGLLLYELVAGVMPHPADTMEDLVRRLEDRELPAPSQAAGLSRERRRALRGDLDRIILHALERDPERRYQSVEQLIADLGRYRDGYPVSAERPSAAYRAKKFVGRNALPVSLAAAAVVVLIAGTAVSLWNARVARREQQTAERRFKGLQSLARSVIFDMYDAIRGIPGSVEARRMLVTTAVKYLDDLNAENIKDDKLQMDIAAGYIRMAYIQGGAAGVNLGDTAGSMKSYRNVLAILEDQWRRRSDDPQVGALRFPAAYNLSMMISDPRESIEFARRYSRESDDWMRRVANTGPMQTSYLLHIALGRMHRLAGAFDESLRELTIAEEIRRRMMPNTARDKAARPMFGIWVDYAQGLFDGGLIAYGRTETLLDMRAPERDREALVSVAAARQLFDEGMKAGRFGPSDRRMNARTHSLKAAVLLRLGQLDEALVDARQALRLCEENTADGSATAQRDLAEALRHAGNIEMKRGNTKDGLAHLEAAVDVIGRLSEFDPEFLFNRVLLMEMLRDQAVALAATGRTAPAELLRRRAADLAAAVAVKAPSWLIAR